MDADRFADALIEDALFGDDGVDSLVRLLPVMHAGARGDIAALRTVNHRLSQRNAERLVRRTRTGIFMSGASAAQARQWAQRLARRLGGTVREDLPHGGGRPHFHVDYRTRQGPRSTGHIFYGAPPAGTFFDEDSP